MPYIRPVVAFVPREVFSTTEMCLNRLLGVTHGEYELVCVDGNSDVGTRKILADLSAKHGFALIRTDEYLSPNKARNMAYEWARANTAAKYIVFVDNDALVAEGWLPALVDCAEETAAGLVGPAYYEYLPECSQLHMYGGDCGKKRDKAGRLIYYERHDCMHRPVEALESPLRRKKTNLIEFHAVLVRMDLLSEINGLDEGLLCQSEHGDLSMLAAQNGYGIWLEPSAKVTYVPPKRLEAVDREFFFLRWSEKWTTANQKRLTEKWGLDPIASDHDNGYQWVRSHRRHGYQSIKKIQKVMGRRVAGFYEKYIFGPLEVKWNCFKYSSGK